MPNLVTYLKQTPIHEWWEARCQCKNGHQKDMYTQFKGGWTIYSNFANHSKFNS